MSRVTRPYCKVPVSCFKLISILSWCSLKPAYKLKWVIKAFPLFLAKQAPNSPRTVVAEVTASDENSGQIQDQLRCVRFGPVGACAQTKTGRSVSRRVQGVLLLKGCNSSPLCVNDALEYLLQLCFVTSKLLYQHFMWKNKKPPSQTLSTWYCPRLLKKTPHKTP